ncbi:MAG: hypothetical protein IPP46_06135 [Bacteroidetes bacterium]|nr:hypothetical protein [Bacteroidota bacterium]
MIRQMESINAVVTYLNNPVFNERDNGEHKFYAGRLHRPALQPKSGNTSRI